MPTPADPRLTPLTDEQAQTLVRIMTAGTAPPARVRAMLLDALAAGLPVNGFFPAPVRPDGEIQAFRAGERPQTIVDVALTMRCEPALMFMLETTPALSDDSDSLLARSLWSLSAAQTILGWDARRWRLPHNTELFDGFVWNFDPAVLPLLAAHGFDLDAPVTSCYMKAPPMPPLVRAARNLLPADAPRMIAALLQAGATASVRWGQGDTFLHCAVNCGLRKSAPDTELDASMRAFEQIVALAVRAGIDLDMTDAAGQTPLHLAAKFGYGRKALTLLEHGARPSAVDAKGRTPLALAKAGKRLDAVLAMNGFAARQAMARTVLAAARPAARGAVQ